MSIQFSPAPRRRHCTVFGRGRRVPPSCSANHSPAQRSAKRTEFVPLFTARNDGALPRGPVSPTPGDTRGQDGQKAGGGSAPPTRTGGSPTFIHTLLMCVSSSIVGRPCMRPWPDIFTPPYATVGYPA